MKIVFDLDGTICEELSTFDRFLAKPIAGAAELIQKLKQEGHTIIIYTARSWAEYGMTMVWLNEHNIPFDILMCGKPIYDIWVDDRAINSNGVSYDSVYNSIVNGWYKN